MKSSCWIKCLWGEVSFLCLLFDKLCLMTSVNWCFFSGDEKKKKLRHIFNVLECCSEVWSSLDLAWKSLTSNWESRDKLWHRFKQGRCEIDDDEFKWKSRDFLLFLFALLLTRIKTIKLTIINNVWKISQDIW